MPNYLENPDKGHIDSIKIQHKPGSVDNRMVDPGLYPFDAFEYDDPSKEGITFRYIRDHVAGNDVNSGNHWVEIQAIDFEGTNRASGLTATVKSGDTLTNASYITDGDLTSSNYANVNPTDNLDHYVQIDLGSQITIKTLKIWHYYSDGRTYNKTKTEVSADAKNWLVVFDSNKQGTYAETAGGHILTLDNIPLLKLKSPWQFEIEPASGINALSSFATLQADIDNAVKYTEAQNGYNAGGGTTTPTQVTILEAKGEFKASILKWNKQNNLTNLDKYQIQVSDCGLQSCSLSGLTEDSETGLNVSSTYYFQIDIDGGGLTEYNITTGSDTTYSAIISLLNNAISGATFLLMNGDLYCHSDTFGSTSTINLDHGTTGTDLFTSLAGFSDFDSHEDGTGHWYSLKFDMTDWKDTKDTYTNWYTELLVHTVPLRGTSTIGKGRILGYRVRRYAKSGVTGTWSSIAVVSIRTVETGDLAKHIITANAIETNALSTLVANISNYLEISEDYGFLAKSNYIHNPMYGAKRAYIDRDEFRILEYKADKKVPKSLTIKNSLKDSTKNSVMLSSTLIVTLTNEIGATDAYVRALSYNSQTDTWTEGTALQVTSKKYSNWGINIIPLKDNSDHFWVVFTDSTTQSSLITYNSYPTRYVLYSVSGTTITEVANRYVDEYPLSGDGYIGFGIDSTHSIVFCSGYDSTTTGRLYAKIISYSGTTITVGNSYSIVNWTSDYLNLSTYKGGGLISNNRALLSGPKYDTIVSFSGTTINSATSTSIFGSNWKNGIWETGLTVYNTLSGFARTVVLNKEYYLRFQVSQTSDSSNVYKTFFVLAHVKSDNTTELTDLIYDDDNYASNNSDDIRFYTSFPINISDYEIGALILRNNTTTPLYLANGTVYYEEGIPKIDFYNQTKVLDAIEGTKFITDYYTLGYNSRFAFVYTKQKDSTITEYVIASSDYDWKTNILIGGDNNEIKIPDSIKSEIDDRSILVDDDSKELFEFLPQHLTSSAGRKPIQADNIIFERPVLYDESGNEYDNKVVKWKKHGVIGSFSAATNMINSPEDLTNSAYWVDDYSTQELSNYYFKGRRFNKIISDGTGVYGRIYQNIGTTVSGKYSASCLFRKGTSQYSVLFLYAVNASPAYILYLKVDWGTKTVTNQYISTNYGSTQNVHWYGDDIVEVSGISDTVSAGYTLRVYVEERNDSGSGQYTYATAIMVENNDYPTPYIQTERQESALDFGYSWQQAGAIEGWIKPSFNYDITGEWPFIITDFSSSNAYIKFRYDLTADKYHYTITDGTTTIDLYSSQITSNATLQQWTYFKIYWDTVNDNYGLIIKNSTLNDTATSTTALGTISFNPYLEIGGRPVYLAGAELNGYITDLLIYPNADTSTQHYTDNLPYYTNNRFLSKKSECNFDNNGNFYSETLSSVNIITDKVESHEDLTLKPASGGSVIGESGLKLNYITETVNSKTIRTVLKTDSATGYPPTRISVYNRTLDGGNVIGLGQNLYLTYTGGTVQEDTTKSGALIAFGGDGTTRFYNSSSTGGIDYMFGISTGGALGTGNAPVGYYYDANNYIYLSRYSGYMTMRYPGTMYMRSGDASYISWFNVQGFGTKGGIYGYATGVHPNLGDSSRYFNALYYKTLNDVGCLGWLDDGVELRDGRKVSDLEALKSIKKHPTKKTIYGVPMLDYETFPKISYHSAPIAEEDFYEEDPEAKDGKHLVAKKGEKIGEDSVEMTSVFSIMIGAIKELDSKIQTLEETINGLSSKTKQI